MDDLISRQAAIDVIDAVFPVDPMKSEYAQGIACGAALAKTYVEQLPSAQPEWKKGKWVDARDYCGEFLCSNCHETNINNSYNYCPYCGAKMKEEEE